MATSKGTPSKSRKQQVRFSASDDISLLKEVLAYNPFADGSKWVDISEALSSGERTVDGRLARERTKLIIQYFESDDQENLRKSGTEEQYGEKEELLEEALVMMREAEEKSQQVSLKKAEQVELSKKRASILRNAALNNLKRKGSVLTPTQTEVTPTQLEMIDQENQDQTYQNKPSGPKKRLSGTDKIVSYLQTKSKTEGDLRREELQLRRDELELQRERFELERQQRMAEFEERKTIIAMLRDKFN